MVHLHRKKHGQNRAGLTDLTNCLLQSIGQRQGAPPTFFNVGPPLGIPVVYTSHHASQKEPFQEEDGEPITELPLR